jgi:hypothetical protein
VRAPNRRAHAEKKEEHPMSIKPSPAEIRDYLDGVVYPANLEALLARARENGADDKVLAALARIPDEDYNAPTAVERALIVESDAEAGQVRPVTPIR